MTTPMRKELTDEGILELKTADDVAAFFKENQESKRKSIVFINSVCGCAAGKARPGLLESLSFLPKDVIVSSVFAGVDIQSTQAVRDYAVGIAPSSPSICFFIGTSLVHFVSRQTIEGTSANLLSLYLRNAYEKFFNKTVNADMPIPSPQELVEIEVEEAKKLLAEKSAQFFDCRSSEEREIEKIEGDTHMTSELSKSILAEKEKNANQTLIMYSNAGDRSFSAVSFFRSHGLENTYSLKGGYSAWKNVCSCC